MNLKEAGSQSNEPRMCIICQSNFTTGVLTVCGHQFCKDCMKQWYKAHHNCPMCKRKLRLTELHDITLKPRELKLHEEMTTSTSPHANKNQVAKTNGIYSHFSSDRLAQINNIELNSISFGTKVDSLVRHILWLRESDPGAKSIIFTQYVEQVPIQRAILTLSTGTGVFWASWALPSIATRLDSPPSTCKMESKDSKRTQALNASCFMAGHSQAG